MRWRLSFSLSRRYQIPLWLILSVAGYVQTIRPLTGTYSALECSSTLVKSTPAAKFLVQRLGGASIETFVNPMLTLHWKINFPVGIAPSMWRISVSSKASEITDSDSGFAEIGTRRRRSGYCHSLCEQWNSDGYELDFIHFMGRYKPGDVRYHSLRRSNVYSTG